MWEILQCAFPDNQQGSKVITTTRIETVAKVCCNFHQEYIYKMKPLDNQNSQKLFFRRLGHVSSQPFKEVSDEILQKCGGLPLAILSIASLLASQPTGSIEQWKYVCSSLSSNLRTHPSLEGMRQILNLSYNHLPRHLKPCLLYIGMYPEDYSIVKKDLLRQWVAEGFISKMQDRDAEEVAESYFNELINRSMIQPSEAEYNGEILTCKMHDMILDLIVFKSEEDNFLRVVDNLHSMNIALQCKVRRLSLHLDDTNQNMTLGKSLSHLRSLAIFGGPNVLLTVSEFKTIRVLRLESSWGSRGDRYDLTPVCKLVHLRYLKIPYPDFVQMPTRMGALQCLETLELERSYGCLNGIPSDIINLSHLLHLIVPSSTRLPDGISNMKRLRTLRLFNVGLNSVDNLKGLGELTNLRDLELCGYRDGMILHQRHMDILRSSIGKLVNCSLRRLEVAPCVSFPFPSIPADELGSLTVYHSHLERLKAIPWLFPRFPMWTGQLRKLDLLDIGVRGLMKEDIDVLAGLPALAYLSLWTEKGPKENIIIRCTAFPVLKFIKFLCSEVCLTFEAGAMPKLHSLELGFDAQGVDLYGRTLDGVEYLPMLKQVIAYIYCGGANESFRMGAEAAFRNAINMHPRRPRIVMVNADRYECGMRLTREVCRDDSDDNDNSMEIDRYLLSTSFETPSPLPSSPA